MLAKSYYQIFEEECESVPVFAQSWYLDCICEDKWDVVISRENDKIIGAWPFIIEKKSGFSLLRMPLYAQHLGPLVNLPKHLNTSYKSNTYYAKVLIDLEGQLPPLDYLRIKMSPEIKSWLPFHSLAYSQTTRYTYIIDHSLGIEEIKRNMKKQLRNVVTKETHKSHISRSEDHAAFTSMLEQGFKAKKIEKFYDRRIIDRILNESKKRNCGTIWTYHNDEKKAIGYVFVIEDNNKGYLLFTCANEEGKHREAVGCLVWHAIKDVTSKKKDFDFEGSMIPGVEKFFRSFGGEQIPFHQITKTNSRVLRWFKRFRS